MSAKSKMRENRSKSVITLLNARVGRSTGKNASEEEKKKFFLDMGFITWKSKNRLNVAFALPLYICIQCNKFRYVGDKYLYCSICSVTYYCSVKCQKLNWSSHKSTCCKKDRQLIKPLNDLVTELTKTTSVDILNDLLFVLAIKKRLYNKELQLRLDTEEIETCLNSKRFPLSMKMVPWELGNYQLDPPRTDNIIKIKFQLANNEHISRSAVICFIGDRISLRDLEKEYSPSNFIVYLFILGFCVLLYALYRFLSFWTIL